MEWRDEGFVLSARAHGENGAIVELFTRAQGRHLGLVRGGAGRRMKGVLQPGNKLAAHWRSHSRKPSSLGHGSQGMYSQILSASSLPWVAW